MKLDRRRPTNWQLATIPVAVVGLLVIGAWWQTYRPEACYRRGRRALVVGDRLTVNRESRRLLATPGFEARGRLLAGLQYARTGNALEALQELQQAAQDDVIAVEALTAGAECYYNLGRFLEAVELSQQAIERDEKSIDAHRWRAVALYDLGANSDAAAELTIVSELAPDDPRPDRLLGLICSDSERFSEAIVHYRRSLGRGLRPPERDVVAAELAEALIRENRAEEALEALRDAEQCARVLALQAECRQTQGRLDEAQETLRRAIDLDPKHLPAQLKLGTLLLQLRRPQEAVRVLQDAVRLAPYSSHAHFQLAQAFGQTGEHDKADDELRRMRQVQADERQFTDLHHIASQKPADSEARYKLGVLARQRGQPDLARMWFRAALAIQPDEVATRAALAELDAATGRP